MLLDWLDSRDATRVGAALADDFVMQEAAGGLAAPRERRNAAGLPQLLQKFLHRVDREARSLKLNLFKRAKLANSFKWRLLEKGVEPRIVDELTQALLVRLTTGRKEARGPAESGGTAQRRRSESLLARANELFAAKAYAEAVDSYREVLQLQSP